MIRLIYYLIMFVASIFVAMLGVYDLLVERAFIDKINTPLISIVLVVFGLISGSRYLAMTIDQENILNIRF